MMIKPRHKNITQFYGRIKYYEGANLILMQPNMFKSIFFQIHDKKITKISSYEKQFKLDSESYIIQMRSEDLILISKFYQLLEIVDINKQKTLFKIKCRDSQKYQGFQYFNSQILFLINENEGQIKNFSMQRYKFTNQHKFKEFIFIQPRFSKYQMNLESYKTIYILNSKTFKIINKSQIIVPDHYACKNIDLLEEPSIANLKDIRQNFIKWLYIDRLNIWCILQLDLLSFFNQEFKLLQSIQLRTNYQAITIQSLQQGLIIFYKMIPN
ncbi:hypothetical protein pb186bvf_018939 [Paramecium bursaria]